MVEIFDCAREGSEVEKEAGGGSGEGVINLLKKENLWTVNERFLRMYSQPFFPNFTATKLCLIILKNIYHLTIKLNQDKMIHKIVFWKC